MLILILTNFIMKIYLVLLLLRCSQCFNYSVQKHISEITRVLSYSFKQFSCVQLFTGKDGVPMVYYEILHDLNIPVINNETDKYCNGFVLFTKNTNAVKEILFGLRKNYNDRIVCCIYEEDEGLMTMVESASHFYGESEALITNGSHTFKLDPVERKCFLLKISEELGSWGKYQEIMNFKGRTITVASFNISMFSAIGPLNNEGIPAWVKGLEFYTFEMLANLMNVTWRVSVPPEDNKWGWKMANGSWSGGIYKQVMERKADVGIGCIWLTIEKYQSFPLTMAKNVVSVRHLVRRPRPLNVDWNSIFRPFPLPIWGLLLAATFLMTAAISFLTHLKNEMDDSYIHKDWASPWTSVFLTIGVLLVTGIPSSDQRQGALRHLINAWVITCFLLTTCFGSSLVSHLTTPDLRHRPETVKELVEGQYFWGMKYRPDMSLVLDPSNPWHVKWAERFVLVESKDQHIKWLDDDKFVLWGKSLENIGFYINEEYLPMEKLSDWETSSEILSQFYFAYALTPGSQLLPAMEKYGSMLAETGHIERLLREMFLAEGEPYMREVLLKTKGGEVGTTVLTISNFQGLFYMFSVGLATASLCFIMEIIHHKREVSKISVNN